MKLSYCYIDSGTESVVFGAWVNLKEGEKDIRTIVSNKNTGCDPSSDRYGYTLYINAWQTNDLKIYLEWRGGSSGCHKLSSGSKIALNTWTHIGFVLTPIR